MQQYRHPPELNIELEDSKCYFNYIISFTNVKIKFYTKEVYCIKKYGILKKIVDKQYKKLYNFI